MKINEVEKLLDIPKATIRFYEKEGLINPQRNSNSYREYSDSDIELLKKIIVLRKIGVTVEDIKMILNDTLPLQDALTKNMDQLQKQMEELKGAMTLCSFLQKKEESLASLDEEYYWNLIKSEERKGHRFFAILDDIIGFEKRAIGDEFGLLDEEGKMKFSLGKSILIAVGMCVSCGLLWFFLDGMLNGMHLSSLIEGLFFPFVGILISSTLGLSVYLLGKKHEKAAQTIKEIAIGPGVLFLIIVILLLTFLKG
ncbi:MAG: MerR family transcriptional regulator [Ruminiclostridium sp.]|nr:MerR family transcriptional regulator [Ruminiclostridium sp.]